MEQDALKQQSDHYWDKEFYSKFKSFFNEDETQKTLEARHDPMMSLALTLKKKQKNEPKSNLDQFTEKTFTD